jgi:endonuclease III
VAYILESQISDKAFRKNWARLIQKIYEVDPLACPSCQGAICEIAVIEGQEVIRKILTHLGLWQIKARHRAGSSSGCQLRMQGRRSPLG